MDGTLTLKDIAAHLKRPESTVRHWRNVFEPYFPVEGSGRARRYPFEAVAVFELISAAYSEGLDTENVEARLIEMFGKAQYIDVTGYRNERSATTTTTQQAPELGREFFVAFFESQRREIEELRQALAETAAACDEAERIAQTALENAVTAKELAAQARDELRTAQADSARREHEFREWIEERMSDQRPPRFMDRVRRILGK